VYLQIQRDVAVDMKNVIVDIEVKRTRCITRLGAEQSREVAIVQALASVMTDGYIDLA